MNNDYISFWLS